MSQECLTTRLAELFGDFKGRGNPSVVKARTEAIKFCMEMASGHCPGRWLTFTGISGTGKTMLARKISRFFSRHLDCLLDERNKPDQRFTRRGGFKNWGLVVRDMLEGDYSGIRDLQEDWFVGLDDIGAEYKRNKDLSTSKLFEILNCRQGLFTVITANLTLDQISSDMDTRIASRLLRDGSSVVQVDAEDFNLQK